VGYQLYIDPEVESWLAALRKQSKADARRVDKALDTLRNDGAALGPPLAVRVEYSPPAGAPGRIVARLLFTVSSGRTAEVFAAVTEAEALSAWYDRAIPAAYPEFGLRVRSVSGPVADPPEPTTPPAPASAKSS
jgi:hypothetical protein